MVFKYVSLRRKQPQRKKRKVHFRAKGSNPESRHQDCARGVHARWKGSVCRSSGILQAKWPILVKAPCSSLTLHRALNTPEHCTWTSGCLVTRPLSPKHEPEEQGQPQTKSSFHLIYKVQAKRLFFFFFFLQVQNVFLSVYRK